VFAPLAVNLSAIPWDFMLILVVLGVIVPWRGAVRVRRLLAQSVLTTSERLSLYASTIALQWLLVAVIYWRSMSRQLSPNDLGLVVSGTWQTLSIALAFTALLCVNQLAGLRKIAQVPADRRGFLFQFTQKIMPQTAVEKVAFGALAVTAGLSEEFIYRGFVFALFLRAAGGSGFAVILAIAASSIWFALAHCYQGRRGVLTTFVVGTLFAGVRIWSGNLAPAILGHAGVDLVAGLCAPRILRPRLDAGVAGAPAKGGDLLQ
jgi:membrane protease YdiL (CAAX protease family)